MRWDDAEIEPTIDDSSGSQRPIAIGSMERPLEPLPIESASDQSAEAPTKIGILGGMGVGKSYLFQALVYRAANTSNSGALAYYLGNYSVDLWHGESPERGGRLISLFEFLDSYSHWVRLPRTTSAFSSWYRLGLRFATGVFGTRTSHMDVDFCDLSGEALEAGVALRHMAPLWDTFRDAAVMIFCLPIWVAFPNQEKMDDADWEARDHFLKGFSRVVNTYRTVRNELLRPQTVLALTMADDERSALRTLYQRWIEPCINENTSHAFLREIRKPRGIASYLASARAVSEYVFREFEAVEYEPLVGGIPMKLNFGAGLPWIVPMTAIDGTKLAEIESTRLINEKQHKYRGPAPIPAHVELPLLLALCERHNALM